MLGNVAEVLRQWVVDIFVNAVLNISREEDRNAVLSWLSRSRDIIVSESDVKFKYMKLYNNIDASQSVALVVNSVSEAVKNYKQADLPTSVKIAIPLTLLAIPFAGGQAAGIAAFGSAIGVPVLLLIFLGSAGISSIIEACVSNMDAASHVKTIMEFIVKDEILRRMKADIRDGRQGSPEKPVRADMPEDTLALQARLLSLTPVEFEHHVMSLFDVPELQNVSVTKPSGDGGVDGFAVHKHGLIVVQCKRYAPHNLVGRPEVQQFVGAMTGHNAWRGYFVTTAGFTRQATEYFNGIENFVPVDMNMLTEWHIKPMVFDS